MRKPHPATVISIIALVMATTGSAVAAVDYASRAGQVDGYSAVGASSSNNRAAGNLVATAKGGSDKGKIPFKFLADVPATSSFAVPFEVVDNQVGATQTLAATPLGSLTASCRDEQAAAGTENPRTFVDWVNSSGTDVNVARRVGNGDGAVTLQPNSTVVSVEIAASQTFLFHVQSGGTQVVVTGAVRQDRVNPATGACLVWGTVQVVGP
jgi:hypothetical protein